MAKELFVSSTPRETKVAVVEDDQLTEIYFERENEYTLAGSIYKGRVARVLPGMQSAFVDVGLERDAFLYVTDFLEEQEDQEEFDQVITRAHADATKAQQRPEAPQAAAPPAAPAAPEPTAAEPESAAPTAREGGQEGARDQNRDAEGDRRWRGRRRRRGRGRGFPESKYVQPERPRSEPAPEAPKERHSGPPPGYQPIILPGESISKYQRLAQPPAEVSTVRESAAEGGEAAVLAASVEPVSATLERERAVEVGEHAAGVTPAFAASPAPSRNKEAEEERLEQMNVAAVFGGDAAEAAEEEEEVRQAAEVERQESAPLTPDARTVQGPGSAPFTPGRGVIVEEEIEEEETEAPSFAESLEEAEYEELEEETLDREHGRVPAEPPPAEVHAAPVTEAAAEAAPQAAVEGAVAEEFEEEQEENGEGEEVEEEEELEEEEAGSVAEGEAPEGEEDETAARAQTRAPGVAGYQQRVERPGFDHRRRGRRGGRRMRRNIQHGPAPKITDLLKEKQEILVQIAKEPIGKKGARITSHIALPGRFLVYMPTVNHIGVSRKIASDEERQRLKRVILAEHEGLGGFIVRTAASGASEDDLRADVRFLLNLWTEIRGRAETGKAPLLIYHDLNLVERILRDQVTQTFSQIWVDTEQEYERVLRFVSRFQPSLLKRVKLYTKETPLFEQFNIQEELNKALKSKVWLKSGGYIVINQTEALVAIDINTGKYVGRTTRLEDTIVKTNVDAIKEIVRQIRLRDLGGIIVIDFIDMDERRNRQKVMQALEEELRHDRAPSKVLAFNDFGLVAITRKRVKQSLERTLGQPCTVCSGTGLIKSVTTVCNEIYVEMRKMTKHLGKGEVVLRVNPEVAKALKDNGARWVQDLEELTARPVIVKSDATLHQEQFDIN